MIVSIGMLTPMELFRSPVMCRTMTVSDLCVVPNSSTLPKPPLPFPARVSLPMSTMLSGS
jgi:hypothetical protein